MLSFLHCYLNSRSSGHDEMCNFYIMYYSSAERLQYSGGDCGEQDHSEIFKKFPPGSDTPLVHSHNFKDTSKQVVNPVTITATVHAKMPQGISHVKVTHITSSRKEDVIDSLQTKIQPVVPTVSSMIVPSEPVKPLTQARANEQHYPELHVVADWPILTALEQSKLGQVTGVSVDSKGQVIVFHRGGRIWDDRCATVLFCCFCFCFIHQD